MESDDVFPNVPVRFSHAPYIPAKTGRTETNRAYSRVSLTDRLAFQEKLVRRFGESPAEKLLRLFDCWKQTSKPRSETQTYEMLVKNTFDIGANVRTIPSDPNRGTQLDFSYQTLLTAYHSYSQKFLQERFGTEVPVHRGLRSVKVAELFAQALDNPARKTYRFKTNVVSNHSTVTQVGTDYSDGIVLRWDADRTDIVSVVDHVRPAEVPSEAEIHVRGGVLKTGREAVKHTGIDSQFERPLYQTVEQMQTPTKMELIEHREVADLVVFMVENDVRVATSDGGDRLETWWEEAKQTPAFRPELTAEIDTAVEYATTPDSTAHWR